MTLPETWLGGAETLIIGERLREQREIKQLS
jgi:hypothetical protein